ncbi:T9SS type A sorting domain-containing protein [Flavobacterium sp.]|uniref:T9SS type A sorting domain-containing protein n=1 Tax=Flavobacterium sp. TaxID=239 RepID=UPI0037512DBD
MRNKIQLLIALILITNCYSQIFVKDNTSIFANNTVVYSKGNIELNGLTSNFYLRNEAQFVQGTTGISTNQGVGKLSVFQEGTSDNYDYNYWCSPIGNASAISGNEDFGITMLHNPTTNVASTPAVIISSGYNGIAAPLSIASYWIWKFLSSSTYSQWFQSAATTNIVAGQGFTMKGTSGTDATNVGETAVNNPGGAQRYDFRGKPNDGNITVNVATNNFTLTGNPYPSALHVNAFLLDPTNSDCTGIAYYWEHDKTVNSHVLLAYRGGYGTYSPVGILSTDYGVYVPATFNSYNIDGTLNTTGATSGLSIERKYAPIGQGFMIRGKASGAPVSVTLKNSHRTFYKESNTYSEFEKNGSSQAEPNTGNNNGVPHIRLNTIINNEFTRQMALVLVPQATDAVDRGIDAKSPSDESLINDIYFFLENDKYIIEGVSFDINKRIPLGIKAGNSSFKFSILEVVNFDANQDVFIYDAADGSYHNLKIADYEVTLSSGVYNSRFELTFKDSALGIPSDVKDNFIIVQNNTNQLLSISNPNLLELKSVQLFDISGKLILNKEKLETNNNYEFATNALCEAVYIVKITTVNNEALSQKIIVERTK